MRSLFSVSFLLFLASGCANSIQLEDAGIGDSGIPGNEDPIGPGGDDSGPAPGPGGNNAPVADAGEDLTGVVPEEIQLDGSASSDPDGDILNFSWELIEVPKGSSAFLINAERADASFYADRDGIYVAELTVDDNDRSSTDTVEIDVAAPNDGPVANAGPDQTVTVNDRVTLRGDNSYDPDGDPLEYRWTMSFRPSGSAASLDDRNAGTPTFTADVSGRYTIELMVFDGTENSPPDQVVVTAVSGGGGGGGGGGCFNCVADEVGRQVSAVDAAGTVGLAVFPLMLLWWRRRQD